jgi:hypothetical protein
VPFSAVSWYLLPLTSKYLPQCPILEYPYCHRPRPT